MARQRQRGRSSGAALRDTARERAELYVSAAKAKRTFLATTTATEATILALITADGAGRRSRCRPIGRNHSRPHALLWRIGRSGRRYGRHAFRTGRIDIDDTSSLSPTSSSIAELSPRVCAHRRNADVSSSMDPTACDPAQSHRHAPAAPGLAHGAWPGDASGRVAGCAGSPALRFHQSRRDDPGQVGGSPKSSMPKFSKPPVRGRNSPEGSGRQRRDGSLRRKVWRYVRVVDVAGVSRNFAVARMSPIRVKSGRSSWSPRDPSRPEYAGSSADR